MILNKTTNKKIISKKKIADTFLKRAIGLMFSFKKNFNYGLIFDLKRETVTGAGIHMFFVFFSINVLFLDKNKKIVDYKRLRPFTIYQPVKKIRYIIELPVRCNNYKINDKVEW